MIAAAESEPAQPPEGGDSLARLVAELEAAPDPHAALRGIAALRQALDDVERANVVRALDGGASLAAIGRDLGISRQAVHRRYGDFASGLRLDQTPRPAAPAERLADGLVLTDAARQTLRHAVSEAQTTGDAVLGGEHVLLALLRPGTFAPLDGVSQERARTHILAASSGSSVFARDGVRPDARGFLIAVTLEARARGSDRITPELLLLTALGEPGSAAARTLRAIGADPDAIAAALASHDGR